MFHPTFEWCFFVPSSSRRSDDDLLREAMDLAHADEILTWRAAVQRWRRDAVCPANLTMLRLPTWRGRSRITDEPRGGGRSKSGVGRDWPWLLQQPVRPQSSLRRLLWRRLSSGLDHSFLLAAFPKKLEAAAMFHEARKRFR